MEDSLTEVEAPKKNEESMASSDVQSLLNNLRERRRHRTHLDKWNASTSLTGTNTAPTVKNRVGSMKLKKADTENASGKQDFPSPRHVREQFKLTRFDEPAQEISKSTDENEFHLPSAIRNSSIWKNTFVQVSDVVKQTKDWESYNFFTSTMSDSNEGSLPVTLNVIGDDVPNTELLEGADQAEEVAEDSGVMKHSNGHDSDDHGHILFAYPVYTPMEEKLRSEAEVYFGPSSVELASARMAKIKVDDPSSIEEGLFIGNKPKVSFSHLLTMNNRILQRRDKGSDWFDGDGLLLRQRNPLRILQTRPLLQCSNVEYLEFEHADVQVEGCNLLDQGANAICQLRLEMSSVDFSHHPLFSCEHVISSRLEKAYQHYCNRDEKAANYCNEKIYALKMKVNILKQSLQIKDPSCSDGTKDIYLYLKEMHAIRQMRKNLLESHYRMLINIVRVTTSVDKEAALLKIEIEDELTELAEMHSFECDQSVRRTKQENKDEHSKHDSAEGISSPKTTFDVLQARDELYEYYRKQHRPPGAPKMIPVLSHTNIVSHQCKPFEELRREDVTRSRLFVKIFFNDELVSQTKKRNLDSSFCIHFNELFVIQIVQWPESIKLQVFDSNFITSHFIAEIFLPIPEAEKTVRNAPWTEKYEFSSNKISNFTHSAVGSGNSHDLLPGCGVLLTSGCVHATLCWDVDDSGQTLCLPGYKENTREQADIMKSLGITTNTDVQNAKKWIEKSRVDPNDPRNLYLFELLESLPDSGMEDFFRIVDIEDIQRFIGKDGIDSNKRFTLLMMRDEGHHRLAGKVIPLSPQHITLSMWMEIMEPRLYAETDLPLLIIGDFYGARKMEQNKFLLDVRERVLSKVLFRNKAFIISDIIVSDFSPNISALKSILLELCASGRPLKPRQRERKKVTQHTRLSGGNINIRVVRAFNVPLRSKELESTPGHYQTTGVKSLTTQFLTQEFTNTTPIPSNVPFDAGKSSQSQGSVLPYVEVSFEEITLRTTSACGPNPSWNEDLSIPFKFPGNDFSPTNLHKIHGMIYINLFDEVVFDILEDDRDRSTTVHHRVEKQWLGNFILPFSTLLYRQKIEGTFELDIPLILLGYSIHQHQPIQHSNLLMNDNGNQKTQLQLLISLDPPLEVLPPIKHLFQSNENQYLLEYASLRLKTRRAQHPSRYFIATALDISGNHVFVTRFIKSQNLPFELSSLSSDVVKKMEYLARYVSLIPYLADNMLFSENCDIWTTSDQFLQMLGGDEEEHAILLCNYFLFCDIKAWLLLGHAVPEGKTAYVLTLNPEPGAFGYWLWNPRNGAHYEQYEPSVPLVSVGSVIAASNVWINIQEHEHPSQLTFDLCNSKRWTPLLPGTMDLLLSVQQDLVYTQTDTQNVKNLQERIERSLRDFIMSLRYRFITKWNRHCIKVLQSILPSLENFIVSPSLNDHYLALNEIRESYELSGFPYNFRYSDIQQLLKSVERTGIHLCENKKAEFALAVYIHAYPNDILSVWVYIVSMIPK